MSGPWEEATVQRGQLPGPPHSDVSVSDRAPASSCCTGRVLLGETPHTPFPGHKLKGETENTRPPSNLTFFRKSFQRRGNDSQRAGAGKRWSLGQIQPAACFRKALLEHCHIHLFTYLWLLLCYRSKVEAS